MFYYFAFHLVWRHQTTADNKIGVRPDDNLALFARISWPQVCLSLRLTIKAFGLTLAEKERQSGPLKYFSLKLPRDMRLKVLPLFDRQPAEKRNTTSIQSVNSSQCDFSIVDVSL